MSRSVVRGFCPHCDEVYRVPSSFSGDDIRCENCGKWFTAGGQGAWFVKWIAEPSIVLFFAGLLVVSWLFFFGGWVVFIAKWLFGAAWPQALAVGLIVILIYGVCRWVNRKMPTPSSGRLSPDDPLYFEPLDGPPDALPPK